MPTYEEAAGHLRREVERLSMALRGAQLAVSTLERIRLAEKMGDVSVTQWERWLTAYMREGQPERQRIPQTVTQERREKCKATWTPERRAQASAAHKARWAAKKALG